MAQIHTPRSQQEPTPQTMKPKKVLTYPYPLDQLNWVQSAIGWPSWVLPSSVVSTIVGSIPAVKDWGGKGVECLDMIQQKGISTLKLVGLGKGRSLLSHLDITTDTNIQSLLPKAIQLEPNYWGARYCSLPRLQEKFPQLIHIALKNFSTINSPNCSQEFFSTSGNFIAIYSAHVIEIFRLSIYILTIGGVEAPPSTALYKQS